MQSTNRPEGRCLGYQPGFFIIGQLGLLYSKQLRKHHYIMEIHSPITDPIIKMGAAHTMRRNLLYWWNLVSISKNVGFYVFGVVRLY